MTAYRTLIFDGSYLVRRPWEAGARNACIGSSVGVIQDLVERHNPERVYVCWEGPPRTQAGRRNRQALDPDYKARRSSWTPELIELAADLRDVYSWLGCDNAWCEDEADDAAAALVDREPGPHLLWSADKDWLQLVQGRGPVHLVRDYRGADVDPITPENIVARTGLDARGWTDHLTLAGDTADGILGVPKIGGQRARALLAAVPNLVSLVLDPLAPDGWQRDLALDRAARIDAGIARWVSWVFDHAPALRLASQLVALRPDSPLTVVPAASDPYRADVWLRAAGLPAVARRCAAPGATTDPWDDLPF